MPFERNRFLFLLIDLISFAENVSQISFSPRRHFFDYNNAPANFVIKINLYSLGLEER